jgi:hypothetical protein
MGYESDAEMILALSLMFEEYETGNSIPMGMDYYDLKVRINASH